MPRLLVDIVIICALSVVVVYLAYRVRLPSIVGFLLTGVIAGPHGLALVHAVHEVEILAEIGVILLLFVIGIEFSLERLSRIRRVAVGGGAIQVVLTILAGFGLWRFAGGSASTAWLVGFCLAISSTAIVLPVLESRGESSSPQGQITIGINIFQDLSTIPMMLLLPLLADRGEGDPVLTLLAVLAKAALVVTLVFVLARRIVPTLLRSVAAARSRDLFLLTILLIGAAVVGISQWLGLSLALGAFLAGLIISETEYSHEAFGSLRPLRDVFTSFFFVSIGMLLDVRVFAAAPVAIAESALAILAAKALIAAAAVLALGFPPRIAILAGCALSPVSEFSFILAGAGLDLGLIAGSDYQRALAAAILSMAAAPLAIAASPRLADLVTRLGPLASWESRRRDRLRPDAGREALSDHLLVVGYGLNGRNVARAATAAGIPFAVIEMNPETVARERKEGLPIHYGDAAQESLLETLHVREARVAVIAISDPQATLRIVAAIRRINPVLHLVVRTRYVSEVEALARAGADEVIPEEFETSIEIFTRVLARYLVPRETARKLEEEIRSGAYEMLRGAGARGAALAELGRVLPDVEIETVTVEAGCEVEGWTIAEADFRRVHAVTLLAIRRGETVIANPAASERILAGDVLVLLGHPERIFSVSGLLLNRPGAEI